MTRFVTVNNISAPDVELLVFLSGSREQSSGANPNIAGIFDLTPDGERLFINAVTYMTSPPPPDAPRFTSTVLNQNGTVTLTWTGGGVLQSTESLSPTNWAPVTGAASPYTTAAGGGSRFYRVAGPIKGCRNGRF